jgi:hypothetical protein
MRGVISFYVPMASIETIAVRHSIALAKAAE